MIKRILRRCLGDVAVWRIFRWDADGVATAMPHTSITHRAVGNEEVATLPDSVLAEQAWYGGEGAYSFAGALEGDSIVGLCFYWHGARYTLSDFWPVSDGQAMLMQIVTTPPARGRGVARSLIQYSARALAEKGLRTLWARVWITNAPSRAAFAAAGWREVAWVVEISPRGRVAPVRLKVCRPRLAS